jgi:hypothetical protein
MEKDKFFFLLSLYAHWQICTKRRHFLSPFGFYCSVECYIYIHIQQRIFCMLPLHNFLVFFFVREVRRTGKKERTSSDDTSRFSLVACCYTNDLFLIRKIGCLRPLTRTFFFLSLADIFLLTCICIHITGKENESFEFSRKDIFMNKFLFIYLFFFLIFFSI